MFSKIGTINFPTKPVSHGGRCIIVSDLCSIALMNDGVNSRAISSGSIIEMPGYCASFTARSS